MTIMSFKNSIISFVAVGFPLLALWVYILAMARPLASNNTILACERLLKLDHDPNFYVVWDEREWRGAAVRFATFAGAVTNRMGRRSRRIRATFEEASEAAANQDERVYANRRERAIRLCERYLD